MSLFFICEIGVAVYVFRSWVGVVWWPGLNKWKKSLKKKVQEQLQISLHSE